jgi:hypothetical protein
VPADSAPERLWPIGSACGVGSLPGTSIRDAVRLVLDELPDFPHLPELPARGPGSEITGRALALLPDFAAEWGPTGWVLVDRPGRDIRRAAAMLDEDLDAIEELAEGWAGPLKVQLCGPWTLAATVELRSGRKALSDQGATRDLHQAYLEAVGAHAAEVAKRLPGATVLVQLDEPALPYVLDGGVPTPSGLSRLAAVDRQVVQGVLRSLAGIAKVGVHCCAPSPPIRVLTGASLRFLSLDATLLTQVDDDPLGEALEAGIGLLFGLVPTGPAVPGGSPTPDKDAAVRLRELWHRLGQPAEDLGAVVVTPTCGLAGASPDDARAALVRCREVARQLSDDPEGSRG